MACDELAALAQAFLIDAVANSGRDVPFGRDAERGERLGRVEHRLYWDQFIGIAMERGLIRHFYKRPHSDQILVTFGLAIVLQEIVRHFYGANPIPQSAPDAFAGTGTMGLEALSRGAASVVFIENDRKALELLRQNVAALKVEDEALCWRADVFRCSFRPKGLPHLLPYDLIFFDPPYRMVPALRSGSPLYRSLERFARPGISADGALLVLRTPADAQFQVPPQWHPDRHLQLSTMEIHILRLQRLDEMAPKPAEPFESD